MTWRMPSLSLNWILICLLCAGTLPQVIWQPTSLVLLSGSASSFPRRTRFTSSWMDDTFWRETPSWMKCTNRERMQTASSTLLTPMSQLSVPELELLERADTRQKLTYSVSIYIHANSVSLTSFKSNNKLNFSTQFYYTLCTWNDYSSPLSVFHLQFSLYSIHLSKCFLTFLNEVHKMGCSKLSFSSMNIYLL